MSGGDHSALLDLIGEVHGMLELDEFRPGLITALARAVPSDWVSINDLGPDEVVVLMEPDAPHLYPVFARLAEQNPLAARYRATGDGRAYRFSDVIARDELHALDIHKEVYGPLGVEHQIAFILPNDPGRILGIALSRRVGAADYTDAERDLLNTARPFLIQSYRNAIEHTRALADLRRATHPDEALAALLVSTDGLTDREAQALAWVALGRSNADVAAELQISPRTVQKHLERAFRKLGVATRSEAAARVWSLAEPASELR